MKEFRGYVMIIGAALFWGASAAAAKYLLNRQLDTILVVQMRATVSCLILFGILSLASPRFLHVKFSHLWRFALLGVIGVAGANFTYYYTIKESTVATGILIQYTAPIVVLAYAAFTREEDVTLMKLLAALVSVSGCALAVGAFDPAVLKLSPLGMMSGVGSIMCFAFLTIFIRHVLVFHDVWTVIFYSLVFASLFWFCFSPPWELSGLNISTEDGAGLVILAIISVLIPNSLYFLGLQYIVPTRAMITSSLEPVAAIITATLFLTEGLESLQIMGGAMVIGAIILLQLQREHGKSVIHAPVERTDAP
jgi:drug/metabolite transporter (DMT)-like permease